MTFIEDPKSITFPCMRIRQPICDFFVGVMPRKSLCDIAYFDVRRVEPPDEKRDFEVYLGIQRPLSHARVEDLKRYVNFLDATFPNSIIIAVESDAASFSEASGTMTLSNVIRDSRQSSVLFGRIAKVIDGQHRVEGLFAYSGDTFEVIVTIFVGLDIAEQAQVFSTVNLEQTKVSKSLAYDLYELAKSRSPYKTCHNVVVALDQQEGGPFFRKIKRLGVTTDGRFSETITQSTFVEALVRYISTDPKGDRDALLKGQTLPLLKGNSAKGLPLRNLFLAGRDVDIAIIVRNYFDAVRDCWPNAWAANAQGAMLHRTNGFRALMRVFGEFYLAVGAPGDVVAKDAFAGIFSFSHLTDSDFVVDRFPPGSSGEGLLVEAIRDILRRYTIELRKSAP